MAETKISWTDYTANPWEGCMKVSPGCDHCYAEVGNNRYYGGVHWGPRGPRRDVKNWRSKINEAKRAAIKDGHRKRVFIASLSDIFEKPMPMVDTKGNALQITTADRRKEVFEVIEKTPECTFLLLTKRPQLIFDTVPTHWHCACPKNVWFGTSITNQEEADRNIPPLLQSPGLGNKFLSIEPMLGPIDLLKTTAFSYPANKASWVIVGGESGHKGQARPIDPQWVESIRNQCAVGGVDFFFKQWGSYTPMQYEGQQGPASAMTYTTQPHQDEFPYGSGITYHAYPQSMTQVL